MYYAKYGNEYLHDPYTDNCLVADLSMTGKINEKGSAKFTIAPTHPLYTKIKLKDFSDPIYIYNDSTILFDGYIYDSSMNFDLTMDINCYGALGYLEDITLRPYATSKSQNDEPGLIYINGTLDTYLEWIFNEYNSRCTSGKNIKLGKNESRLILPSNSISRSSNEYPTVASELESEVLDKVGGYFFLRHDGKTRYVDYFSECTDVNTQVIDFGENLLDFTQSNSTDSMCTSIIPVGSTTRLMLNGSEISGANYLEDSGGWGSNASSSKWSTNDSSSNKVEVVENDGRYCIHGSGTVGQTSTSITLEWNTPYVYSAYIKFERSGEVSFNSPIHCWCEYTNETSDFSGPTIDGIASNSIEIIDISTGNKYSGNTTVSANKWYKIIQYFRTIHQPSGYKNCLFRPWVSGELANGGWWLYWIKLEKGSIQSDWTANKDKDASFVSVPLNIKDYPDGQLSQAGFSKYEDSVRYDYALNQYGVIEKNVKYSDYGDMSLLVSSAIAELNSYATPVKTITIKAIDLALLNKDYKALAPGQLVRIRSTAHGVDQYMMLSEMDVDLEDPSNTEYTFGATYDTLTGQQSKKITELNSSINRSLDAVSALTPEVKAAAKNSDDAKNDANQASIKADNANQSAINASKKAEAADNKATNASQQANSALTASKDAADKAIAASKAADEASAKATLAETNSSEAKEASQNAIKAANDANTAATTASTTANKASADAADAIKSAQSANDAATDAASKADAATTEVGKVKDQIVNVNGEITNIKSDATKLRDDLTGQITSVKETMEADYAKTTDLTATSETLRNEITSSAAGTLQTVSATYAKKTELETTTTLAQEAKDAASTNAKDLTNAINKVNTDMSSLQDQIDGAIETWFFDGVPSNDNKPASDWTTDTLKKNHLGDLYYDNLTGYSYRWQIQNGVYSWSRITDVDVTKALKDAKNAQETANSKRRVFSSTPYPPYDEGDLWVQGESGDILRCTVSKTANQTYSEADWSLASKYTDDSAVTTLKNTVETTYATKTTVETLSDKWSSTASSVETVKIDLKAAKESAKQANDAATAAQASANTAIENAAAAQTKADEAAKTASDATENAATANTAAANAQKAADDAAKKAATAQSNADTANAELATAKQKLEEIQNQANATDEQVAAAKAAVEKAQSAADKANTAASTANTAASNAQKAADTAKANAATAQSTADTAKANAATAQTTADTAKANAATAQSTADNAKKTADKATEDLAAVTNRVTIAETNISNNAEAINLRATKTEVTSKVEDAIETSKSYTDAQLKITSESITSTVSKTYATKTTVDALKNIADSAIETWTGKGVPTLTNLPASKWDTNELKKQHSGDLYYDTDTNYAYRFGSEDGITYSWSLIKDTEITKALTDAANAKSTANSASTAASNAQKAADTANSTANSVKADLANNYTTTTDMNSKIDQSASSITATVSKTYATKASLDATNENVTNAQNTANSASTAASNAQKVADTANSTANSVKEDLANNYTTTTDMNSQIKVESDRITSAVSRITNTENNITTLSGNMTSLSNSLSETQTQLVQNSETLTARIISAEKMIGDQTTTVRNVDSYMQFADPNGGSPQLTIGTSSSNMKTVLTNEQLRFEKNGVALLTVDGASSSVKTKNLRLGGYQWQSPDVDRLQLIYIGGE